MTTYQMKRDPSAQYLHKTTTNVEIPELITYTVTQSRAMTVFKNGIGLQYMVPHLAIS
jgi:hypothetical protein